jgi:hypothetical protein
VRRIFPASRLYERGLGGAVRLMGITLLGFGASVE